jgi:hypothetical protein
MLSKLFSKAPILPDRSDEQLRLDFLSTRPGGVMKLSKAEMARLRHLMPQPKPPEHPLRHTWQD